MTNARPLARLRATAPLRNLVRETTLTRHDLILPMFVVENAAAAGPIKSMPGVSRHSLDGFKREVETAAEAGVPALMLFGLPATKDAEGSSAWDENGIVPRAVRAAKSVSPDLVIFTDVCLCQYTSHGHCGLLRDGHIQQAESLPLLARTAAAHAAAGADLVAPSSMFDGMVAAIRAGLDAANFTNVGILSYAVKFSSAFYGPFRDAADSTPAHGDRRSHQMDPANAREAVAEALQDAAEGADLLMVKPAGAYLDVIAAVKRAAPALPLAAYQVSGEYAMIEASAERGWIDRDRVIGESLLAMKRAGADLILTYYAAEVARGLGKA